MEAQLREVWIETGHAGVEKVYDKAVKKGLAVTRKQVQEFVKGQASAQVFQPRAESDGSLSLSLNRFFGAIVGAAAIGMRV